MNNVTLVIPSLNPDEKLIGVVEGAISVGFTDILLVNDGSKPECADRFAQCAVHPQVTVLVHEVNRGKGAALKTAMAYVAQNRPASLGIVTADGDGQHASEDILACAARMTEKGDSVVLGVRDFTAPDVQSRSKFGNRLTSFVFLTGVGLRIRDTQTGLRAIPARYYPVFLATAGDRYEYETNMLLDLKQHHIPYDQLTIRTIYIDENQTSHFHPVRDSIRIYSQIIKFCAGSLLGTAADYLVFLLLSFLLQAALTPTWRILIATVGARAVSSLLNFWCNRSLVFADHSSIRGAFLRYYALAVPQMAVSAGLVRLLTLLLENSAVWLTTGCKLLVDTALFLASYQIQKRWVFRGRDA